MMNARIRELAEQAETKEIGYYFFDKEKFAELIVRECVDWCNVHASVDGTAQKIAESIKKDFGVEQ